MVSSHLGVMLLHVALACCARVPHDVLCSACTAQRALGAMGFALHCSMLTVLPDVHVFRFPTMPYPAGGAAAAAQAGLLR